MQQPFLWPTRDRTYPVGQDFGCIGWTIQLEPRRTTMPLESCLPPAMSLIGGYYHGLQGFQFMRPRTLLQRGNTEERHFLFQLLSHPVHLRPNGSTIMGGVCFQTRYCDPRNVGFDIVGTGPTQRAGGCPVTKHSHDRDCCCSWAVTTTFQSIRGFAHCQRRQRTRPRIAIHPRGETANSRPSV